VAGRASTRIARRLGGPTARRRRHRRAALAGVLVVVVAVVLIVAGSGGGDGDGDDVVAGPSTTGELSDDPLIRACQRSNAEIATARAALLRDNDAPGAAEGFLADAFVDLSRDRSAAVRATDPAPEVVEVLDAFDAVVDAIEADPSIGIGVDPFASVNERWRALGLDECIIGGGTVAGE
jgi:hypothetical protein